MPCIEKLFVYLYYLFYVLIINSAANSELIDIDLAPVVYSNYDPDIHINPSLEDIYDRLFEFNERGLISTTPLETLQGIPDKMDIMYFGLFALCAPKSDMIGGDCSLTI